jgi:hypothetical protein
MQVEMLPTAYGDCILISYGTNPVRHILIDSGTHPTLDKYLRPHLISEALNVSNSLS